MAQIEEEIGRKQVISEEDALQVLDRNEEELLQYLFYTSAKYIKRLKNERFKELRNIIADTDEAARLKAFTQYLKESENVKKLQQVFPIIITTCISAHGLGEPEPLFDMVIIDEASQCNTAISLVPIIRGHNLMLVGDPQQLNPVIVLDDITNRRLKKQYHVPDEYDYKNNSIYKTFLSGDSVSDEILLRNHYRCNPSIIGFNNKKYYNHKLKVCTESKAENPLVFVDIQSQKSPVKNASEEEVRKIIDYVKVNQDKTIGIITPFVN